MKCLRHTIVLLALAAFASGCGSSGVSTGGSGGGAGVGGDGAGGAIGSPSLPWPLIEFPALPAIAVDVPEERLELGRLLFYDPVLSVDDETACATCHSELWGMGDGIELGVGHSAGPFTGPGRDGPNISRRNSQALYNLAFRKTLLWDGRAASLEEQALLPLLAEEELDIDPDLAVERISEVPEYVDMFAVAFPDDPRVTADNLAAALAAFQRTFVSDNALYDAYLKGDLNTLDDEMVKGMFRFAQMGCDGCHTPPLFESETFADRNVPSNEGVVDLGLAEFTELPEDNGKFRTPSLRNSFVTEPYFHNGSAKELKDAVEHELEQSGMPFTDDDVFLIEGFIHRALRDESRAAERPDTVPSGLPVPIDTGF
jgi:cytochrome c peroxidase